MGEDDLLREASDPTTPGERLVEMWLEMWRRKAHGGPATEALLLNPALPIDLLGRAMIQCPEPWCEAAWYNPAAPLVLLHHPLPAFAHTALRILQRVSRSEGYSDADDATTLTDAIALWTRSSHEGGPPQRGDREARDLARHLAALFGLPWPEPPAARGGSMGIDGE